ncbi:MAG: Mut7-C RNAse domain-containing protein [Ignavibacteriales bacterium]|nr:Mut7-C RNAse domain-containing protein [Ignavibacteriales bacterium]
MDAGAGMRAPGRGPARPARRGGAALRARRPRATLLALQPLQRGRSSPRARSRSRRRCRAACTATHREFRRCPRCERIYWAGSHVARMRALLEV